MNEVSHTVARGLGDAAAAGSRLVEKCVDHAVAQLQQAELQASGDLRQQISAAWRELLVRRKAWSERYPKLLGPAFQAEAAGKPEAADAPGDEATTLSLSLVDDTEIARTIESARLAQQLTSMLERPLAELDGLMSSALGLDGIQPERNPLRPAVYAQVLRDLMTEAQPDPTWPGMWMRHMTKPMAQELEQVYREQSHFLTLQRVHAANYRLRASAGSPASRPAPLGPAGGPPSGMAPLGPAGGASSGMAPLGPAGGAPSGMAPLGANSAHAPLSPHGGSAAARAAAAANGAADAASGFADLPMQEVDAPRLQQFLMRGSAQAQQPLAASYYAQAEAELRMLQSHADEAAPYDERAVREHMHLPPVDRPPRHVDTQTALPRPVWGKYSAPRERALVHGKLKTEAREAGQVLGLEVVRRLVDRVADDPRLLGPVREAIVGLEPSLLRLAMVAPRFFSDAEHPGRLLVEAVAQRSFKYNDEFSVDFQGFLGPVVHAFRRLNDIDPLESADPFRSALGALQAGWAAQDTLDEENQRKVLEAVQFAERRQHDADRIASEFRQRPDLQGVPEGVRDFVLGPWSLVVAHARLTQPGAVDPGGHIAVVTDLLWSVQRDLTLREPARAFEVIPRVLMRVRAGLTLLGQQPEESEPFFRQLEQLHRPVMKLRAKQRHSHVAPAEPPPAAAREVPARAPGEPWLAPKEMEVAGFDDGPPSDFSHSSPGARASHVELQPLAEHEAEDAVARLTAGSWVDLYVHHHWRRARLKWASEKRTLFMFVSHGGQPHSMTLRSLQRLVREHLLRPVDGQAVVPRAIARLAHQPAHAPA